MEKYWTWEMNGVAHLLARLQNGLIARITKDQPNWVEVPNLFGALVMGEDNEGFTEVSRQEAAHFLQKMGIDPSILDEAKVA